MAKQNLVCPGCGEEIKPDDKKFQASLDTPYTNTMWHRHCWIKHRDKFRKETRNE